jgi:hypothetical protein
MRQPQQPWLQQITAQQHGVKVMQQGLGNPAAQRAPAFAAAHPTKHNKKTQ